MNITFFAYNKNNYIDSINFSVNQKMFTYLFYSIFELDYKTFDETYDYINLETCRERLFYLQGEELSTLIQDVDLFYHLNNIKTENDDSDSTYNRNHHFCFGYILKFIDNLIQYDQILLVRSK